MFFLLLQKLIFLGCIGVLIENVFTGIWSLLQRNWKLTSSSYLWMFPIYGFTGLLLDVIRIYVPWPWYLKAFIYLPIIYGAEALSGLLIVAATAGLQWAFSGHGGGEVPWQYKKSSWSPLGLINLKYSPFWLALAFGFEPLAVALQKVVTFISTQV